MNILFLGGDKRYEYMMEALSKEHSIYQIGFDCEYKSVSLNDLHLSDFDVVLFPINGLSDNLEIKTPNGMIQIPSSVLENIDNRTKFFTGLKTKKLLEFIPDSQIISFLDCKKVEEVNNSLTVDGTISDIQDKHKESVCILGYRKTWKGNI